MLKQSLAAAVAWVLLVGCADSGSSGATPGATPEMSTVDPYYKQPLLTDELENAKEENSDARKLSVQQYSYYGFQFNKRYWEDVVNGNYTYEADIPTAGSAHYQGGAWGEYADGFLQGESSLDVDFGTKKFKGSLTFKDKPKVTLSGHGFSKKVDYEFRSIEGSGIYSSDKDKGLFNFRFYGPQAAEVVGRGFSDYGKSDLQGFAFGGKKTSHTNPGTSTAEGYYKQPLKDFYTYEIVKEENSNTHKMSVQQYSFYGFHNKSDYVWLSTEGGIETYLADIPTAGSAHYQGGAWGKYADGLLQGKSSIDVDFGMHELKGTVTFAGKPPIKLLSSDWRSVYPNNTYVTGISYSSDKDKGRFDAQFYGPQAAEVVGDGYASDLKDFAFGAKKQ